MLFFTIPASVSGDSLLFICPAVSWDFLFLAFCNHTRLGSDIMRAASRWKGWQGLNIHITSTCLLPPTGGKESVPSLQVQTQTRLTQTAQQVLHKACTSSSHTRVCVKRFFKNPFPNFFATLTGDSTDEKYSMEHGSAKFWTSIFQDFRQFPPYIHTANNHKCNFFKKTF